MGVEWSTAEQRFVRAPLPTNGWGAPAGQMFSTASDMTAFMAFLLSGLGLFFFGLLLLLPRAPVFRSRCVCVCVCVSLSFR